MKQEKTKLQRIREALASNQDATVVRVEEHNYLPHRKGYFNHTIDFYVAPAEGLYTAHELQEFMMNLVPELETTSVDVFWDYDESISFGKLYFDESIGLEKIVTHTEAKITDPELANSEGFTDGYRKTYEDVTQDLRRRTWVRVYPNQKYIHDLLVGRLEFGEYRTDKNVLKEYQPKIEKKYQPNILGKIARIFSSE